MPTNVATIGPGLGLSKLGCSARTMIDQMSSNTSMVSAIRPLTVSSRNDCWNSATTSTVDEAATVRPM